MSRYRVGPVRLDFRSEDPELLQWAARVHSGREDIGPADLHIELKRADETFHGPHPPQVRCTDAIDELRFHGWRASYNTTTGQCSVHLSDDTTPARGARRVEGATRTILGRYLLRNHGVSCHAAAMIQNDAGYLFVGERGAGKTTLVRTWPGATVLGDDHSIIERTPNGFHVHGTPYTGREGTPCAVGSAPLRAIVLLRQSPETRATNLPRVNALAALTRNVIHIGQAPRESDTILTFLDDLTRRVPTLCLHFNRTDPIWPAIEAAA